MCMFLCACVCECLPAGPCVCVKVVCVSTCLCLCHRLACLCVMCVCCNSVLCVCLELSGRWCVPDSTCVYVCVPVCMHLVADRKLGVVVSGPGLGSHLKLCTFGVTIGKDTMSQWPWGPSVQQRGDRPHCRKNKRVGKASWIGRILAGASLQIEVAGCSLEPGWHRLLW